MTTSTAGDAAVVRNLRLYPLLQACRNLYFWQAVWFLYLEGELGPREAIVLAAVYDLGTVVLEVPSGYLCDVIGRRWTFVIACLASCLGCALLGWGSGFAVFALAQALQGLSAAFASGTGSALLYESLAATGREHELTAHEVRAHRYSFAALALSAVIGGGLALIEPRLTYLATAAAAFASLGLAWALVEPDPGEDTSRAAPPLRQLLAVAARLRDPALAWLTAFAVLAIVLEDVPYVLLQSYFKHLLAAHALAGWTPAATGGVIAAMMAVSAGVSGWAPGLQARVGLAWSLVATLALQLALVLAMTLTLHPAVAALLVLRMVPRGLRDPLVSAATQPRLERGYRATFLSLVNLVGRLVFTLSLLAVAWSLPPGAVLDHTAMQAVAPGYLVACGAGTLLLVVARSWLRPGAG
ncbi:MAG: MFS transporter [Planctomycetes bacterium]|nr:MFS transporter [Planctomycetota bacterium]